MAKTPQSYVGFTIAINENIFLKSKIFAIDPLTTNNG